jgi:cyclic beta-1,2-glucan synthetase
LVLRIDSQKNKQVLQELLRAHQYCRKFGIISDLVILNEQAFSYAQETQNAINSLCETYRNYSIDSNGKRQIFTLKLDMISTKSFHTLLSSARFGLHAINGSLSEQLTINQYTEINPKIHPLNYLIKNFGNTTH